MIQPATCKFCKAPINLIIDDEYAAVGRDIFGLIKKAACNRCGDYVLARQAVKYRIKFLAENLAQKVVTAEDMPGVRETLTVLLKKMMRLYAEHHNLDLPDWDEMILENIVVRPRSFEDALSMLPKMFQQRALM